MNYVFLALSAPYKPWNSLYQNCIIETWGRNIPKNRLFVYEGKRLPTPLSHPWNKLLFTNKGKFLWRKQISKIPTARYAGEWKIKVSAWETWDNLTTKFLSAAQLLLKTTDFDFLIRINTTTYVNLDKLGDFLKLKHDYVGFDSSKEFATGWAIVMSRDVVTAICSSDNLPIQIEGKNDDRLIGELAAKSGYELKVLTSVVINEYSKPETVLDTNCPFIRIKSSRDRLKNDPMLFKTVDHILSNS